MVLIDDWLISDIDDLTSSAVGSLLIDGDWIADKEISGGFVADAFNGGSSMMPLMGEPGSRVLWEQPLS